MTASLADKPAMYRIQVQGRLEPQWAARLGDLTMASGAAGDRSAVTDLTGWVADQAALLGVLGQLYALGVTLLSVERVAHADGRGNNT
jgi:hypothetical protein